MITDPALLPNLLRCGRMVAEYGDLAGGGHVAAFALACEQALDAGAARFVLDKIGCPFLHWHGDAGRWRDATGRDDDRPPWGLPTRHRVAAVFRRGLPRVLTLSGEVLAADGPALRHYTFAHTINLTPPHPPAEVAFAEGFVDVCIPAFGVAALGLRHAPRSAICPDRATAADYARTVYAKALRSAYPGVRFSFTAPPRLVVAATDPPFPFAEAYAFLDSP